MSNLADEYVKLCEEGVRFPDVFDFLLRAESTSPECQLEVALVDQFQRWKRGQAIPVDYYFQRLPQLCESFAVPLLVEEYGYLEERGVAPSPDEFVGRYTSLGDSVHALLCEELGVSRSDKKSSRGEGVQDSGVSESVKRVGRYEVVCSIGKGAFGEVFLGRDVSLDRSVAIKVPSRERIQLGGGTDALLAEAQTVAKIDHPNIVPVYDFGETEDGGCYIVSKYVRGKDLASESRKEISHAQSAGIVATLARALQAAHSRGVIHRDVKPANIILDAERTPHLLDFGLALRRRGGAAREVFVGTPAYMSPEQRRGEGDAVDGRSDIFSMGIIFYELLCQRRPFAAPSEPSPDENDSQLWVSPTPPRQLDDSIPRELERVCLKALAFRPENRYNAAADMAEDLERWLRNTVGESYSATTAVEAEDSTDPASESLDVGRQKITPDDSVGRGSRSDIPSKRRPDFRRRIIVAGMISIAGIIAAILITWIARPSALRQFADTYLPEFARGYLAGGWNLKPDYESGYFYRSAPLLAQTQQSDSTVTAVAVKTTAPRYQPVQVTWSPQGDRLAVVTRRGQLRIYHWDGRQLTLRTVYRSDTANDWVRCFRWHPFDGSAAIATGRGIVIAKSNPRGEYDISLLIGKIYETSSIDCLVDQGRVLYVFGSKTGVRAWDPLTETVFENFLPESGTHFATSGLSDQYMYLSGTTDDSMSLETWVATWDANIQAGQADASSDSKWRFRRKRTLALEQLSRGESAAITGIVVSDEQAHVAVLSDQQISIFDIGQTLEPLVEIPLKTRQSGDPMFRFFPATWAERRTGGNGAGVVWCDDARVLRAEVSSRSRGAESPASKTRSTAINSLADQLSTEMLGARLRGAEFDLHPSEDLIAVAFAGGLEVWNARFETVSRVPSVDCVWDVIPLQLHDKCMLLRRDGGGLVVRTRGEPLGEPVPPVLGELADYEVVQQNSIVEPELHLVQSTYEASLKPSRRNLTESGIVAVTTPSRHTFSMVPQSVYAHRFDEEIGETASDASVWQYATTYEPTGLEDLKEINRHYHRVNAHHVETTSIAQRAQRVVISDDSGNYGVRSFRRFGEDAIVSGELQDVNRYLAITVDPDATTLFAATGGPGETTVLAHELNSDTPLWRRKIDGWENGANLVWLRDRLLVTSWFGWHWIDARWGELQEDVSPRAEHGIRHGQIRKHPLDETLLSWHRYEEIEPAAAWSNRLDLEWLAFAASDGQWLILSPTGKLLHRVTVTTPLENRFVGPTRDRYRVAEWAPGAEPRVAGPSDSLTLVKYHSDGRTTCEPFVPLQQR